MDRPSGDEQQQRRANVSRRHVVVRARAAGLLLAMLTSLLLAPSASAATSHYRSCALSVKDQRPPGRTPAYNLAVGRRHTACRVAVAVMKRFHRCRTSQRFSCGRTLPGGWSCTSSRSRYLATVYAQFTCAANDGRRVHSSYQQDTPNCYGAAARDRLLRCFSQVRTLFPKPGKPDPVPLCPCDFGVAPKQARATVALIGDSHTLHWREALNVVAVAERWHALIATTGGCFFSAAAGGFSAGCGGWYESTQAWLHTHPEISTIFVTSNADSPVDTPPGTTMDEVKIDGFTRAWHALPKTVKHVIVLRDLAKSTPETLACIAHASEAGTQRLAPLCPIARAQVQQKDLGVQAVRRLHDKRYQAIDLSQFVCGAQSCYPAIGGVQVNGDQWGHLLPTFMRTLGPYLLREVRHVEASW